MIRLFGYRAAFVHGDVLMLDRWKFLKRVMPRTANSERVLDVGCGSGAFTIGLAKRGYLATGLSHDANNQAVAAYRAALVGDQASKFPIGDARRLGDMSEHREQYDYLISFENIEHVLDDRKLMRSMAGCLRAGGWLVLTTPNKNYRAVTSPDNGPFPTVENGWHVRRGYTAAMLRELCDDAGLMIEEIGYCSGFFSQKLTMIMHFKGLIGWCIVLPFRFVLPLLDRLIAKVTRYPFFCITLVAYKPRFVAGVVRELHHV